MEDRNSEAAYRETAGSGTSEGYMMRGDMEPNEFEMALKKAGEQYMLECDEDYCLKEWLFRDIKARRILARLYRQYGRDRLVDILEDFVQDEKISSRM